MVIEASAAHDVAIIGGGPVGSTVSTLLRKYNPHLRVLVIEKERFPREHVGESQLPSISPILDEMGAWEKVEAAGFPVKIGASYTWGRTTDRWDFDFFPLEQWSDDPRPARYEGQRLFTAFQVDRATYDEILLRHAEAMGAEVRERTKVDGVLVEGDRVTGLRLDSGEIITARHYVDGSGNVGLIRRALGVEVDAPRELRNIAIWDYWENAQWAVEIGVGATRVQVRSLPYGWMWFIPLGPTRTSIGLICPTEKYREGAESPEALYARAVAEQPDIAQLTRNATRSGLIRTVKDWSQLADRIAGENWFLAGEAAGFADPILAAGMSLAHTSARHVAYTILELERGEHDARWLRELYDERNRNEINRHIRFAQFWYSANGCFTDLQEHCAHIADEAGLKLSPAKAWQWLSQGGFASETGGIATAGSFDLGSARRVVELFDSRQRTTRFAADGYNVFKLNLEGAESSRVGVLRDGRIHPVECYIREKRRLPLLGLFRAVVDVLYQTSDGKEIFEKIRQIVQRSGRSDQRMQLMSQYLQAFDSMIQDGWILRKVNRKRPVLRVDTSSGNQIRFAWETREALDRAGRGDLLRSNIDDRPPSTAS
jgi:flavin-dependent dehydrogenase